jgi:hypothetical protein
MVLLALAVVGAELPLMAWMFVAFAEGLGCWLLARFATVAP